MKRECMEKYMRICERAKEMGIMPIDTLSALMDIECADMKFKMRLDEWLNADDFNFMHDFVGIQNNIQGLGFPAAEFGGFIPRFAG